MNISKNKKKPANKKDSKKTTKKSFAITNKAKIIVQG